MISKESFWLALRSANRQIFNPTCIKHNQFDLHIATAKNCGTHWIKYMMSHVLSIHYGLPEPEHIRDDSLVGHTKTPPIYNDIPQIATTHSHPHYLMRFPSVHKLLNLPKFYIVVRDIPSALISLYAKWHKDFENIYGPKHRPATFADYVRGRVEGTRMEDVWGLIMFYNAWGATAASVPNRASIHRYEDWLADPEKKLHHLCQIAKIENVSDATLRKAIEKSSKENMAKNLDPTEKHKEKAVNLKTRNPDEWYSEKDKAFLDQILNTHLRYSV